MFFLCFDRWRTRKPQPVGCGQCFHPMNVGGNVIPTSYENESGGKGVGVGTCDGRRNG